MYDMGSSSPGLSPNAREEEIPVLAMESKVLVREDSLKSIVKYRVNKHGYKGVFYFLCFVGLTLAVIGLQHNNHPVSALDHSLQQFANQVGQLESAEHTWSWLTHKLIPQVFK